MRCQLCNFRPEDDEFDEFHKGSAEHRFNWALYLFNNKRETICKNRRGVTVRVMFASSNSYGFSGEFDKQGRYSLGLSPEMMRDQNNHLQFECLIENSEKHGPVIITYAGILYPHSAMSMKDPPNNFLDNRKFVQLNPGAKYKIMVMLNLEDTIISNFKIPIYFAFQTEGKETFGIARSIVVGVYDSVETPNQEMKKSPFTRKPWENDVQVVPCGNQRGAFEGIFEIPAEYSKALKYGLDKRYTQYDVLQQIRRKMHPDHLTKENYADFLSILLWLDEVACTIGLSCYNMENVNLEYVDPDKLKLEVPGLAEKRPSVIVGDTIEIRIHKDHTAYQGVITMVADNYVLIGDVNDICLNHVRNFPDIEMDVRFVLGRINYERMHQGVRQVVLNNYVRHLFPDNSLATARRRSIAQDIEISRNEFYNRDVYINEEQRTAVLKIVNNSSRGAPYIVYGPPGTGKTMTLIEAIMQLKRTSTKRILVCAPANAACNMLAEKLIEYDCTEKELKRVMSKTAELKSLHPALVPYSNVLLNEDGDADVLPVTAEELTRYRVVVMTLIRAGMYTRQYHPDVVFIDEAAQPSEAEVCCAIGLLLDSKQLVLGGDPKQLGPVSNSKVCQKFGYDQSIVERLMARPPYKSKNADFITMLKLSYRSHPTILRLPNEMFYEGLLKTVSVLAGNDPVARIFLYPLATNNAKRRKRDCVDAAIEFCSVVAKERREGRSPSYYNDRELQMVVRYVRALVALPGADVKPSEIGVITPYIRQVYKILDALKRDFSQVEVGTTEAFQGREKRVIVLSTVRSQEDLLLYDSKYKLGFVKNEKRFNVAITRAKSKLIVVGNPMVLATDDKWLRLIDACQNLGTYGGAPFVRRTEEVRDDIVSRIDKLHLEKDRKHRH
ncbi:putative helicase mov-10-B.1 [Cylas formicarius]|uniref:putative helicase mov-10-B.1 n=1 Tax=Cylas formicarius TaxID=197179 RepID=UPI002958B853|nr:putative helicase mov-10-B.1 [Cylas formicarius]